MEKTLMVSEYLVQGSLERVNILLEGTGFEIPAVKHNLKALKDNLEYMLSSKLVPMEMVPGTTKLEIVESMNLGKNIDYALPRTFVNLVNEKLGYYLCPDFVFDCKNWVPIPITLRGRIMLPVIYKVVMDQEVPDCLKKYLEK